METYTKPDDVLDRLPAVEGQVALGKSTIYKRIKERRFPAPVKATGRASRWRRSDIQAWLRDPAGWTQPQVEA